MWRPFGENFLERSLKKKKNLRRFYFEMKYIKLFSYIVMVISDWDYHEPRAIVALHDEMAHFHIKTPRHTPAFVF